ncbi:ribosomal-protein-alanine acetyltransferase [Thalassovita gelatinovora]|uniref:Ribosomal-protein-alanine acetyltransferase n=1 Tax=Thalassovita gelatinovora TaxID=53501 RepID=A0A0P1FIJ6_THAGE|nr:GNAT family N-acetyltransferase [Thalassovita gelatinovora]QIZ82187.1 GNAT family N-acetyltransferase [Thalassovita gelatinovora]CUH67813.1 ribosomal-protein-alanine acetyltransferase [Thalassovita gelatinovora]SEP66897.1 Ribosomal protein S18 acetylase RimI [Thalassovita gelatinovora]
MTLRLASPADAPAIAALLARLADETGDGARFASTPDTIRAHGFGPTALFATMIAEHDSRATGIALFFRHYSSTRGQPGVYVQDLWTAPELRGQGLGARLLAAVADHARRGWGACYMALTTHGHNDAARAFYTRLGFTAQPDDIPMALDGAAFSDFGPDAGASA